VLSDRLIKWSKKDGFYTIFQGIGRCGRRQEFSPIKGSSFEKSG
jgi:hypothetical protein